MLETLSIRLQTRTAASCPNVKCKYNIFFLPSDHAARFISLFVILISRMETGQDGLERETRLIINDNPARVFNAKLRDKLFG